MKLNPTGLAYILVIPRHRWAYRLTRLGGMFGIRGEHLFPILFCPNLLFDSKQRRNLERSKTTNPFNRNKNSPKRPSYPNFRLWGKTITIDGWQISFICINFSDPFVIFDTLIRSILKAHTQNIRWARTEIHPPPNNTTWGVTSTPPWNVRNDDQPSRCNCCTRGGPFTLSNGLKWKSHSFLRTVRFD